MPIQFDVDPAVAQLAASTAEFVREVVIPAERECGGSVHDAPEALRETLQKAAREAGVFAPTYRHGGVDTGSTCGARRWCSKRRAIRCSDRWR